MERLTELILYNKMEGFSMAQNQDRYFSTDGKLPSVEKQTFPICMDSLSKVISCLRQRLLVIRIVSILIIFFLTGLHFPYTAFSQVTEGWAKRYNGPNNGWDYPNAIAVDALGDVYVTGNSATVKYDASGNQVWQVAGGYDPSLAIDSVGNVYVTKENGSDYTTMKYDSNGSQLWVAYYNGLYNGVDHPNAITVDTAGNVYVTGNSNGPGGSADIATVTYDSNGNQLWVARYNSTGYGSFDKGSAIAVDTAGNVYVTGRGQYSGYVTIKYDSIGNQVWIANYSGGSVSVGDYATALAIDSINNILVTGLIRDSGDIPYLATIKYDSNGNQLWVRHFIASAYSSNEAISLALDNLDNPKNGSCPLS